MPVGLLVAGFLLAHAAIHVGFVAPPPPATADGPAWPFAMDRAWPVTRLGVDPALMRSLALALVAVTIAGFAWRRWRRSESCRRPSGRRPSSSDPSPRSALLAACFQPWLLLGVVIDLALLWSSLVAGWQPAVDGSGI